MHQVNHHAQQADVSSSDLRAVDRRGKQQRQKGQTTVEYAMVISVLSIALLSTLFVFTGTFASTLEILSGNLKTSLMDDGIRK